MKLSNVEVVHAVRGPGVPTGITWLNATEKLSLTLEAPFVVVRPEKGKRWGIPLANVRKVEFQDEPAAPEISAAPAPELLTPDAALAAAPAPPQQPHSKKEHRR